MSDGALQHNHSPRVHSTARQEAHMLAMEDPYLDSRSLSSSAPSTFESAISQQSDGEDYEDSIDTSDEELQEDQIMKGTMVSVHQIEFEAPALPPRSELRRSQIIMLKTKIEDETAMSRSTAVHEHYLSSEEDVSSEADDFSDYSFDSESEASEGSTTSSRKTYEIIARAVSVVYSGKPIVVDVPVRPRSVSPMALSSSGPVSRLRRVPGDAQLGPDRRSISSSVTFPIRSSSFPFSAELQTRPDFLDIDPYAVKEGSELSEAKTPTAMFKRKFNLTRSKTKLQLNKSDPFNDNFSFALRRSLDQREMVPGIREETKETKSPELSGAPVSYQDILSAAKRNAKAQAQPATSPVKLHNRAASGSSKSLINALSRRKSVKI